MELAAQQKMQIIVQRRHQVAVERYNHHLTQLMLAATETDDEETRQAIASSEEAIRVLTAADAALAREAARVAGENGRDGGGSDTTP